MHKRAMLTMRMLAELVLQQGWPIARAAERMNVSRPTARKWVRRYEAEGEAGLAGIAPPRPSGGHTGCLRRVSGQSWLIAMLMPRGLIRSGGSWVRTPPPSTECWPATAARDCGNSTAPPGRWCATSATGPASWSTSTSKKQGRIPDGGGWRAHGRGQASPTLDAQHGRRQPARLGYDYVHQMVDDRTPVPTVVSDENSGQDPDAVIALGGTAAVSRSVLNEAAQRRTTDRLAGSGRFDTAAAIAAAAFPGDADRVYLARADDFADALAAGALSEGPILLVPSAGSVPAVVRTQVNRQDPDAVVASEVRQRSAGRC